MSVRSTIVMLVGCGALVACASTDAPVTSRASMVAWGALWPELVDPAQASRAASDDLFPARRPDAAALAELRAAEAVWRAHDDDAFATQRDAIAQDPVAAFWLTRMLVRDALVLRKRVEFDPATMLGDPRWQRPIDQLVAIGAPAAPCIVVDLLRDRAADRRDLGVEVLQQMGPEVLPAWDRVLRVDDLRARREALRTIAGWEPTSATLAILVEATKDSDFGIRAEAYRGLGRGGPVQTARLRAALDTDGDPFVQRAIVEGLGSAPERANGERIVAYLERAVADKDTEGVEAANRALMRLSGERSPASVPEWRRWLASWEPGA